MRVADRGPTDDRVCHHDIEVRGYFAQLLVLRFFEQAWMNIDAHSISHEQVRNWPGFGGHDDRMPAVFLKPANEMKELDRCASQRRFVRNKKNSRPLFERFG